MNIHDIVRTWVSVNRSYIELNGFGVSVAYYNEEVAVIIKLESIDVHAEIHVLGNGAVACLGGIITAMIDFDIPINQELPTKDKLDLALNYLLSHQ